MVLRMEALVPSINKESWLRDQQLDQFHPGKSLYRRMGNVVRTMRCCPISSSCNKNTKATDSWSLQLQLTNDLQPRIRHELAGTRG